MKVETVPWITPNFVRIQMPARPRQEGVNFKDSEGFRLEDVDVDTLSEMCDQFRADIFRKSGKKDPRK